MDVAFKDSRGGGVLLAGTGHMACFQEGGCTSLLLSPGSPKSDHGTAC